MSDSFLVYDGGNGLFRTVAKQVARRSAGIRLVPWRAEPTRQFLKTQFGDHLFVFVLVDPDVGEVHAGGAAIRHLLRERGVSRSLVDAAEWAYRAFGDPFGRVVHGQVPADIDGTFPLADDAQPHVESLRRECRQAACRPDGTAR